MKSTITFKNDEDGIKLFATFISQIIREGVTYEIHNLETETHVVLTGGY